MGNWKRCVIDTNVAITANDIKGDASPTCISACAHALRDVMVDGHVFVDEEGQIVAEYRSHLSAKGQPGPGDLFFKWLLTHEWGQQRVTRVSLTSKGENLDGFEELPDPPDGVKYDPSDKKFLAVAAAHPERPTILQASDSKWWGWRTSLKGIGVEVHFLCADEISSKYKKKMGE